LSDELLHATLNNEIATAIEETLYMLRSDAIATPFV